MPIETRRDSEAGTDAVVGEVLSASAVSRALATGAPVTVINMVFINVASEAQAADVAALLGAGDAATHDADDAADEVDADAYVEDASEARRATGEAWRGALRAALDAGRRRPRTPPSVLLERYQRIEVDAHDGARLVVRPPRTECLESVSEGRRGERESDREAGAEGALRELLRAVRAERDPAAGGLFRRALGRAPGAVGDADLAFLRGVFRGLGSPSEVARALALVDRYQGAPAGAETWEREAALVAYHAAYLGLAPEGFALNYVRSLRGSAVAEVTPRAFRATTDDLAVGDLVVWSGARVAVVERVFNLLSHATRVEVIELRPEAPEGLARVTYAVRPGDQPWTFRLADGAGPVALARFAAPA